MFSWLDNLDKKRWWNMLIITSFIFAILFGAKVITIINPQAGFLISLGFLFVAIGEGANHKKVTDYHVGKIVYYNPFSEEIQGKSPTLKIPKGYTYKRKPIFIGILFDVIGIALIFIGLFKLL